MVAIQREITDFDMKGTAYWVYFGGGTPNTLNMSDLATIVRCLRQKTTIKSMGIELLPVLVTEEYLEGLKSIGFTKISVGVESFSPIMNRTGRKIDTKDHIQSIIDAALSRELWVNVDIMVGLPDQDSQTFLNDIRNIIEINPQQVTIYPFMNIRGVTAAGSMPEHLQFMLIEKAYTLLKKAGYFRKGIWTFSLGDDVYDSSRDELVHDYIGFGPAAFSTYGGWKIVNPGMQGYLKNAENKRGFLASKSKSSDDWRKFARMVYDLKCKSFHEFPPFINLFVNLLQHTGYCKNGGLTEKGLIFAHVITKAVVESLPFPLQNPHCVENYDEYVMYEKT
jgi:coproporphyrinogen III oxidase-like Fe-S oxidoreductase